MSDTRRRRSPSGGDAITACVARVLRMVRVSSLVLLGMASLGSAAEPLPHGRGMGEPVTSFYCRAVTGPLMNRSVCYVCRYGDRPVVLVLARRLVPGLSALLQDIDRTVDRNRARGLRSVGVLLSDDPSRDIAQVQTFAFDHKLAMPLAVATESLAASGCYNLPPDTAVMVVLYRRQHVVTRFALRDDDLAPPTRHRIAETIAQFATGEEANGVR